MASIKAVCLDAAGTLFRPRQRVGAIYARHAVAHGLPATPDLEDALEARFRAAFAAMPAPPYRPRAPEYNAGVDRDWWRRLVAEAVTGLGPLEFDAFFDAVYQAFAEPQQWCTYPETLETLARLRDAGLPVAIVSNFDARLLPICRGLGLAERVDAIIYSAALGAAKPDPAIFHEALACLGTPAAATLHVGDSFREDVAGARAAGLYAVHLRRDHPARRETLTNDPPVITDLTGLLRHLS